MYALRPKKMRMLVYLRLRWGKIPSMRQGTSDIISLAIYMQIPPQRLGSGQAERRQGGLHHLKDYQNENFTDRNTSKPNGDGANERSCPINPVSFPSNCSRDRTI